GRAHARRLRCVGFPVQIRAGAAHRSLHRREPVSRHAMGGLRAQRRAALGADWAEYRRVHAKSVSPGRLPGKDAAGGLLRQVRPRDHDSGRHQSRRGQYRRRLRAAQTGGVRGDQDSADRRPNRGVAGKIFYRGGTESTEVDEVRGSKLKERIMAQFSVNAQRFDPYKNFKFRVKWDGKYVAGVSKVGALKRTTEVVEHREGGDPSTGRKSPGRTKFEAISLERGVTHDKEFEAWANK